MSSLLKSIFTTTEQVNYFIEFSNMVFIIIIIYIGIKTYNEYKDISKLVGKFVQYIYDDGFNSDSPKGFSDDDFKVRYWDGRSAEKVYGRSRGIFTELNNKKAKDLRVISFQNILNEAFSPVVLKLKKANSYFEGLASLGLFGTVFGLLVGALSSNIEVLMSSFSTALVTTFLGLLCQLIIRFTRVDVIAENEVEDFQVKIIQLVELVKKKPEKLDDNFLNKFNNSVKQEQSKVDTNDVNKNGKDK